MEMNHENITHVHPLTTADECIGAIRFLLGPTFADPISDELSRLNRERFQAPYGITKRKELTPYMRRIDRRKARHQKRNFLHDSIEEYYDDMWEMQLEMERDLYSENEFMMMEQFDQDYEEFFEENRHLLDEPQYGSYDDYDPYDYDPDHFWWP